ncbi:MAG: NAD(P)H-dependent oxidoreductase subunit E [bacterium]
MKKSGKKTELEAGPELNLSKADEIISRFKGDRGSLIPVLQEIQEHYGYIPQEMVSRIAQGLKLFPSSIYGVMTFYAQFHLKPRGKNVITACCGTACHVKGSERLINSLVKELAIPAGEDTSADLKFTVEKVNCLGACSIAPAIIVNKTVHGKMTSDKLKKEIKALKTGETKSRRHGKNIYRRGRKGRGE